MGVKSWSHIGGAPKDTIQLSGNIRGNASGEGLGSSENNSWNAQYRYMVAIADNIDFITTHIFDAKVDLYYSKKVFSKVKGLWLLLLGSPKGAEINFRERLNTERRLKTAELWLNAGMIDRTIEILEEVFSFMLLKLKDGYTFKGTRAKVRIRSGVAGDMDDLVGSK